MTTLPPPRRVEVYFDYLSPYAYFGQRAIRAICERRGIELVLSPVLFPALLNHWGQRGPAEIPAKRAWVFKDAARYAALHRVPFVGPKAHPFNPLTALRLSLVEVGGADQAKIVETLFDAGWGRGIDLGAPDELARAIDEAGLDGKALLARTSDVAVKDTLKKNTETAIARGTFGVPTFVVGDELFWGSDRMDHIELALDGRDPLDSAQITELLARPRGADRRT